MTVLYEDMNVAHRLPTKTEKTPLWKPLLTKGERVAFHVGQGSLLSFPNLEEFFFSSHLEIFFTNIYVVSADISIRLTIQTADEC